MLEKHPKYKAAPVAIVLAAMKINGIVDLDQNISSVHDALREIGYLDAKRARRREFNIEIESLDFEEEKFEPKKIDKTETISWIFIHESHDFSLSINEDVIGFQSSGHNGGYQLFSEMFRLALSAVKGSLGTKLSGYKRVGLRYVNYIDLSAGNDSADLIDEKLLGGKICPNCTGGSFKKIEHSYPLGEGHLMIRYNDYPLKDALPQGITPEGLKVPPNALKIFSEDNHFSILDLDRATILSEKFELDALINKLDLFHQELVDAFESCTTATAKKEWGRENE